MIAANSIICLARASRCVLMKTRWCLSTSMAYRILKNSGYLPPGLNAPRSGRDRAAAGADQSRHRQGTVVGTS